MPTILLVDDNRDYRESTGEVLEMEGYTVVLAENGAVALALLQQSKPDLILSNGNMPVMTGLELLQAVKADEQLNTIPFILVTGRNEESFLMVARNLGVTEVMLKPVLPEQLLELLSKFLK
jgi:two-component system, sensor histidine kinase and response regulator